MRTFFVAFVLAALTGGPALAATCYLSQSGPVQPGCGAPVVYNGTGAATLTLPGLAWQGTVVDAGPGAVTLVGAGGAPVNGVTAGVTLLPGSGGAVAGDPAGGWWYGGPTPALWASFAAAQSLYGVYYAAVAAPGSGAAPGDLVTLTVAGGSTSTLPPGTASAVIPGGMLTNPVVDIINTQVVSATVAAGGSGCGGTSATLTGTTGTGTLFTATVPVSGGALSGSVTITAGGQYLVNPTTLASEPVSGDGCSGATLALVMGAKYLQPTNSGALLGTGAPTTAANEASTTGGGTGLAATVYLAPLAAGVIPPSQESGTGAAANSWDTKLGFGALQNKTIGQEETAVGWGAGLGITSGNYNTALGTGAMAGGYNATGTATSDVAVGVDALRNGPSNSQTVAIGASAMRQVMENGSGDNVAVGYYAMPGDGVTTSGVVQNTALGALALGSLSFNGTQNVAVGYNALAADTTGGSNTALGTNALDLVTTASTNVAVGNNAGIAETVNGANTFVGNAAGKAATTGSETMVGYQSGLAVTGGPNTLIGAQVAHVTLTTGSNDVVIGTNSSCDTAAASTSNTIEFCAGAGAVILATGTGTPSTSVTTIEGGAAIAGLGTAVGSDYVCIGSGGALSLDTSCGTSSMRLKRFHGWLDEAAALAALKTLRPVVFSFRADDKKGASDRGRHVGLYAEDVAAMDPRCAIYDREGRVASYDDRCVIAYLVAAVAAQQREIAALRRRLP